MQTEPAPVQQGTERVSGADNGAERPEKSDERSGAVRGVGKDWSGTRSGKSRRRNGAMNGDHRNKPERGAAKPSAVRSAQML